MRITPVQPTPGQTTQASQNPFAAPAGQLCQLGQVLLEGGRAWFGLTKLLPQNIAPPQEVRLARLLRHRRLKILAQQRLVYVGQARVARQAFGLGQQRRYLHSAQPE